MLINCKGTLTDLSQPKIMGILNCTPDSFYDGGRYKNENEFLQQAERMLSEGADFIDIGAYSSKPNAEFVSTTEELQRIVPVVELILKHFPDTLISIDTFRADVAKACIAAGAAIINDISAGLLDTKMLETVGQLKAPYIMMHMRGTPQTMTKLTQYDDIVKEMLLYFSQRIEAARNCGIDDIIIDPGFGFAKTLEQNYEVLQKMELFKIIELPILAGVSRKSMIYKLLGITPQEALNGTTVLNTVALTKGANILRVHDVKEAVETVKIMKNLEL
ncbi:dihydropteroate synthase [Flavobacterium salilacus subsp. salilacus]|uniref:dihydropteroate synthase n=1 Tax=Flavobacterium TaxID=237 RepID=UPI001074E810|nr:MULTISPECIES: dihydropteroate synthase [Flavobacterium]KAF2517529.1 dihydropteroate synthase [Flavobacterium salilacus subsp. salilacus]MBE1615677.1 dihydropteroate synthase [Flavobacterium sp. SaA2.13]